MPRSERSGQRTRTDHSICGSAAALCPRDLAVSQVSDENPDAGTTTTSQTNIPMRHRHPLHGDTLETRNVHKRHDAAFATVSPSIRPEEYSPDSPAPRPTADRRDPPHFSALIVQCGPETAHQGAERGAPNRLQACGSAPITDALFRNGSQEAEEDRRAAIRAKPARTSSGDGGAVGSTSGRSS